MLVPLAVGRPASLAAVGAAHASEDNMLVVVAQRDESVDEPDLVDLYPIGTRAVIRQVVRGEQGTQLAVLGVERVRLVALEAREPYRKVRVVSAPISEDSSTETEALHRAVMDEALRLLSLLKHVTFQPEQVDAWREAPLQMVYLLGSILNLKVEQQQALLEASTCRAALNKTHEYLTHEVQVQELRQKIASAAESEMGKERREYLLRQQLRAIQQELGDQDPEQAELSLLTEQLEKADLPEAVLKEARRELGRLGKLPRAAPDYQIARTYLELVSELPWNKTSEDRLDVGVARQVLDEDHHGLKEVKERILEHLAVMKLNAAARSPILCFVGPPGVGKTSLGQSIARALGRRFERTSLGGLHDEAELRGHRRT